MTKIARVDITDIRCITQMTLQPKTLNILSGTNDQAKTTVLLAIKAVFEGGHNPSLRRQLPTGQYSKKGTIRLTGDDGTVLLREITETRSTLTITQPDGTDVQKPQEFVERLAGGFSFDPLAFVTAKPKERLAYLQRAMNLSFTSEEVSAITATFGLTPARAVDMDGLNAIRKQVYDARTKENTLSRQADGTVERLSGTLAEDDATDWDVEVRRIQGLRDAATEQTANALRFIDQDADARIAEINRQRAFDLNVARAGAAPALESINQQLGAAAARMKHAAANGVVRQEVETAKSSSESHKAVSAGMTAALQALDDLKTAKLNNLPISGVDFRDGDIEIGGLPFDSLNDGKKFFTAFQVGALLPGDLGIMIADRCEILGPESWKEFQDQAIESGYQVFCTRVTAGPLKVERLDESGGGC